MIINCPECNTSFRVPANLLGLDGRVVRCGRCQHEWQRAATEEEISGKPDKTEEAPDKIEEIIEDEVEVELEEVEVTEPLAIFEESRDIAIGSDSFIDKKFIAVSFAVFLLLTVMFSLLFPMKIIRSYPQVYPIYKMLSLVSSSIIVNPVDAMYRQDHYGQNILYIELELENITDKEQIVLPLQVELYGADGVLLKDWPLPARGNKIPKHETMLVKFGLRDAPSGGRKIAILHNLERIYGIHTPVDKEKNKHEEEGH